MRSVPTFLIVALALAAAGCTAPSRSSRTTGGSTPVYQPPSEKAVAQRSAELQQRGGYSKEAADRKARQEASQSAWQSSSGSAWAEEQQRARRSAEREKMEKSLAKIDEP